MVKKRKLYELPNLFMRLGKIPPLHVCNYFKDAIKALDHFKIPNMISKITICDSMELALYKNKSARTHKKIALVLSFASKAEVVNFITLLTHSFFVHKCSGVQLLLINNTMLNFTNTLK